MSDREPIIMNCHYTFINIKWGITSQNKKFHYWAMPKSLIVSLKKESHIFDNDEQILDFLIWQKFLMFLNFLNASIINRILRFLQVYLSSEKLHRILSIVYEVGCLMICIITVCFWIMTEVRFLNMQYLIFRKERISFAVFLVKWVFFILTNINV